MLDSVMTPIASAVPATNAVLPDTNADAYETLMQFLYRAPIGLVQTNAGGDIEILNPMSAQLLMPLAPDGNLDNLLAVLDRVAPGIRSLLREFDQLSGVVCDGLRIRLEAGLSGRAALQVMSISVLKLDAVRFMTVLTDVTLEVEREQLNLDRGLDDAAHTDSLTHMPNRAALRERLQKMMQRGDSPGGLDFAVLFMNCDRFKQINDTLGQAAGDEVLGLMSNRLRTTLRHCSPGSAPGNTQMVARIGSDEFVVVLDGVRRMDDARSVARRVLDALAEPYETQPHAITCSVSMGVVLATQVRGNADAVLQDANIAMVEAKRAGGAQYVVFEPAMRERAEQRGGLEAELRRAIAERELFVMYQPVVGFSSEGRIDRYAGVEALVRWRHATRGIVPPLEFIGVAEECGLIGALGDFVLETACADFCRWQNALGERAPRSMAVNLSRAQLTQAGWAAKVVSILAATGMPALSLQLEITESLAAQDVVVQQCLHEIKALGVRRALDDFGTGYSSLACLHLLPVDTVKIDRSFVTLAASSPHHQVLIEATVRVAHSLGMNTVAEGIETVAQADIVQALGCDKGQGYLYSRPLLFDDLVAWMRAEDGVTC
ncbi:MAG: hypothetical protein NVSMB6_21220 [Burkholderiaceae bacterium]